MSEESSMSLIIDPDEEASALAPAPWSLWRNRDYMFLWSGQLVSTLGTGVSQIAFPLLVLALTHSAAQAGLLGAFETLPYLLFSLPAGALVARWDRKLVMVSCDMPDALIGVIFAIGPIGGIVGALLAPRIQRRFGFGAVITTTVCIEAVLWPLFAVVPHPLLLGVVMAGLYMVSPIYNAVQFSYRLSLIPDKLQGRVNSAFRLLALGGQPLGAALSGLLISARGPVFAVMVFWGWYLFLAVLTTVNRHIRAARQTGASRGT